MLKQRVMTALILVVVLLAALFTLPAWSWQIAVALLVWQGAVEWARLAKLPPRAATVYCVITLVFLLSLFWLDGAYPANLVPLPHFFCYCAAVIFWVLVVPAWMIASWKPQNKWLMSFVGWLIIIPTGLAMIDLHQASPWLLLGAMSVVWVADSAAYFAGRRFGKNKLAPTISPGKTWEGVFGALVVVTIYVLAIGFGAKLFQQFPGVFPGIVIASWWYVGLAVIGDLFESAVKRQAGVKDSGALLPGHGGLLDRIDALTSTLPFVALTLALQQIA